MTGFAITGTGMVTSLGSDSHTTFAALCEGRSGRSALRGFDESLFNVKNAYEIPDRFQAHDVPGRATKWLCSAIDEAVQMAGLNFSCHRTAVIVGSGLRELRSLELRWTDQQQFKIKEMHFADAVQLALDTTCAVLTISNACAASLSALAIAEDMLTCKDVDIAVVAGCDSITESMFGLIDRAMLTPPQELQPFDRNRRGVLMGEGAAAVVLESRSMAAERGATPKAFLRGVGTSCDAVHETGPDLRGVVQAMLDAHARAGVMPRDIDLVMLHGTGTALNDFTEARAMTELFGSETERIPMTALKSSIGHTAGASGLIALVTAIECFTDGRVPPTIGIREQADEAKRMNLILDRAPIIFPRVAQINAFGFGGINAVAILERAT